MMNTVNASTKFMGFELHMGCLPRLMPSLHLDRFEDKDADVRTAALEVKEIVKRIKVDIEDAKDNLTAAKSNQAFFANKLWKDDNIYEIGDKVMLNTSNRRKEYINGNTS
jgi:hypothetical protein